MPKVELSKLRLSFSKLTGKVYVFDGGANKSPIEKLDATQDFIHSVIEKWKNTSEVFGTNDGKKYEVSVKEIK